MSTPNSPSPTGAGTDRAVAARLITSALLDALAAPGWAGRRAYTTGLLGMQPSELYTALAERLDTEVEIRTGGGTATVAAITAGSNTVIPYLVTSPGDATSANSGGPGFAATLRTQFTGGDGSGDGRVLVVLAKHPDETVTTASDDAAVLPDLAWAALVARTFSARLGQLPAPGRLLREILDDFTGALSTRPAWQRLATLNTFLATHGTADDGTIADNLHELGEYLRDPSARTRRDLQNCRDDRLLIEAATANPTKTLEQQLRAKGITDTAAARVAAATGPAGTDFTLFTREDMRRGSAPPAANLDPQEPVSGARLVLQARDGGLILALPAAGATITLTLDRPLEPGENVRIRFGSRADQLAVTNGSTASISLHLPGGDAWEFGWLHLPGRTPLPVAATFDDRAVIAIEESAAPDPAQRVFICAEDPVLRCWEPPARDAGVAELDEGDAGGGRENLTGTSPAGDRVGPVPVLSQRSSGGDSGDGEGGEGPGGSESDSGADGDGDGGESGGDSRADESPPPRGPELPEDEYLTFPHAAHALSAGAWPEGAGTNPEGVIYALISTRKAVIRPRLGDLDLAKVERLLHKHPDGAQYTVVGDQVTVLTALPTPQPAWEQAFTAFVGARRAYFAAASAFGSAYAVDPRGPEARRYTSAYRDLLWTLPRTGLYRSDYDTIVALDLVEVQGCADLLASPLSPLSVAYHAALAERLDKSVHQHELTAADIAALRPNWVLPLLNHHGGWYESQPADHAFLWRRYQSLETSDASDGRNSEFIRNRIEFFLSVHPQLSDPRGTLALTCADPGDGTAVLEALRRLYRTEIRTAKDGESYRLPRLDVSLIAAADSARDTLAGLLSGGRYDDTNRLIATRCTFRLLDDKPSDEFAHLSFLFKTPGGRGTAPVEMAGRAPTTAAASLATSPGRLRIDDADPVFATGVFAAEPGDTNSDLEHIQFRLLELIGGQGGERLQPGWTRMTRARASDHALNGWYDSSAWVVHLDRMIGIDAFAGHANRNILEYEDNAEPHAFGHDGITATRYLDPYLAALRRSTADLAALTDDQGRGVMALLESVSGRWTLQIIKRALTKVRERVGTACAVSYLGHAEAVTRWPSVALSAIVALEELVPGYPEPGIPARYVQARSGKDAMCDDLLVLALIPQDSGPPLVSATVAEIKFSSEGGPDLARAADQVEQTNAWLQQRYGTGATCRDLRGAELAELLRTAADRNRAFGLADPAGPAAEAALAQVTRGEYAFVTGSTRGLRDRRGIVISVEAGSATASSLTQLNGPQGPLDLVTLDRAWLTSTLAGEFPARPGAWSALGPARPPAGPGGSRATGPGPAGAAPSSGNSGSGGPTESAPAASSPAAPATPAEPGRRAPNAPLTITTPLTETMRGWITDTAGRLDRAFARYGLPIEGFDPQLAQCGPSLARFRTRAVGRLSLADVSKRARDLTREIEASAQILVSDEPGYITVDVPRTERDSVALNQVLPALAQPTRPGALDFVAGITPAGEIRTADLSRLPHLLVAGATGSGKSVFLRGILAELLRARTPDQLQLLIIDPKQLDFAPFARAPHLRGDLLHDPDEALERLQFTLPAEIELRRPMLQAAGASSAAEFYERGGKLEDLPQLVIVIDEFADLVLAGRDRKAFSEMVQRYAQLTRAYGIYLVLSTQRPSVDVITGSIKANLTARLAFALPSYRDSMTILDRAGAEDLLGDGDLLFYRNGKVERLQAPFTSLDDITAALGNAQA